MLICRWMLPWFRRVAALAAALAVAAMAGLVALAPAAGASVSDEYAFLAHLNGLRAAHGLPGLAMSADLTAIARQHSNAMMAQQTIFHNANLQSEVSNWQVLGENVGMGPSVSAIDQAFDNSPEHYANEVNPYYTQVGIGSVTDSRGEIFVTLDFREPMYSGAASSAPAPSSQAAAVPAGHAAAAPAPSRAPAPAAPAHPVAAAQARPVPPSGNDPLAHALRFADTVGALPR